MGDDFSLDLDNLLSEDQLKALEVSTESPVQKTQGTDSPENTEPENIVAENLGIDDLFGGSEGVGKEKDTIEHQEGTESISEPEEREDNISPDNLYSSFAQTLKEEGILSSLSDEDTSKIIDAESFLSVVKEQIKSMADEQTRRVQEALEDGVDASEIKVYEKSIANLNAVSEDAITDESERGVNLRRNLIYNDYLTKGLSQERAKALADRSIGSDNEIEDAKEALESMKEFYTSKYNEIRENAHKEAEKQRAQLKKDAENLRKSILDDPKAFGEVDVDANTRRKMYEMITKTDKDGMTEILRFNKEHHNDFMKGVAYCMVVTDGFKNLNKLTEKVERTATKRGIQNLENILSSTSRNPDGSLRLVRTSKDDGFSNEWSIDS